MEEKVQEKKTVSDDPKFKTLAATLLVVKPDNSVMHQKVQVAYEPGADRYLVQIRSGFLSGWIITLDVETLRIAKEQGVPASELTR